MQIEATIIINFCKRHDLLIKRVINESIISPKVVTCLSVRTRKTQHDRIFPNELEINKPSPNKVLPSQDLQEDNTSFYTAL